MSKLKLTPAQLRALALLRGLTSAMSKVSPQEESDHRAQEASATVPAHQRHTGATEHAPRITLDLTRIVGCTCGWRTPPDTADSDVALAVHVALAKAGEQP
jgi:hypothetical protein